MTSVDSRVDPVTRSVTARAEIPNLDRLLRPGMLMSVQVFLQPRQAIVVPIAVVQVGSESFVYRLKPDGTVERAVIALGSRRQGAVEVTSGLAAGERIVVEGTVKLREGTRVVESGGGARKAKQ